MRNFSWFALISLAACQFGAPPPEDAGSEADAGGTNPGLDGGGETDAGDGPVDAGSTADSGTTTDSGTPTDAGRGDAGAMDSGTVITGSCAGKTPLVYNAPTDRLPHTATPPALGDAGSFVTDPVYGTKMLRLTDVNTVAGTNLSYRVANEFWGNDWNTDATRFYIQDSNGAILGYQFDPVTMTATPLGKLPFNTSGGFSRVDPNILYGMKGLSFVQYDFATQQTTTLVDLHSFVPDAGGYALGVSAGANGMMACSFGGPQQDKMPYIATWDPATGAHHLLDTYASTLDGTSIGVTIDGGVHTVKLEASGRFLAFSVSGGSNPNWLWDTSTNTIKRASGGGANGWGAYAGHANGDSYQWAVTDMATQVTSAPLINPVLTPTDSLASAHVEWQNAVAGALAPLIVETMRQPLDTGPWRAWDDELVAVQADVPDGGATVWRFAHNFNTYTGTIYSDNFYYLFIPRVSQNGWFAIIDSNWNQSLGTDSTGNPRTDVFIVALPNPCGP